VGEELALPPLGVAAGGGSHLDLVGGGWLGVSLGFLLVSCVSVLWASVGRVWPLGNGAGPETQDRTVNIISPQDYGKTRPY
jgi:hypothetical protein